MENASAASDIQVATMMQQIAALQGAQQPNLNPQPQPQPQPFVRPNLGAQPVPGQIPVYQPAQAAPNQGQGQAQDQGQGNGLAATFQTLASAMVQNMGQNNQMIAALIQNTPATATPVVPQFGTPRNFDPSRTLPLRTETLGRRLLPGEKVDDKDASGNQSLILGNNFYKPMFSHLFYALHSLLAC